MRATLLDGLIAGLQLTDANSARLDCLAALHTVAPCLLLCLPCHTLHVLLFTFSPTPCWLQRTHGCNPGSPLSHPKTLSRTCLAQQRPSLPRPSPASGPGHQRSLTRRRRVAKRTQFWRKLDLAWLRSSAFWCELSHAINAHAEGDATSCRTSSAQKIAFCQQITRSHSSRG